MLEEAFGVLLEIAAAYAACGLLVAGLFATRWRRSFDPSAATGTWGFCLLIVPGVVALWPLILAKVRNVARGGSAAGEVETPIRPEALRRNHGLAFVALAIIGPLLFIVALVWRAPRLEDAPVVEVATRLNTR